ncbi:MAG: glutamate-1-semialdehyde 2,1-aminomutase [Actinomycetota bacterium]|nr:glutamate-1-semialdehyde 2,1-aminomutase [Actinomycetota bacterium]
MTTDLAPPGDLTSEGPPGASEWYRRALEVMPGGVNSPVRAFRAVGGAPPFIASGHGAHLHTIDGNELVDLIASWGALILGHAHPEVVGPIREVVSRGTSFGVSTTAEVELAELICCLVPSVEMVRMVNSGTEATASILRLARAATGRPAVVKFEGCYHGHADAFLVKAGSGLATFGEPSSPGVPTGTTSDTRVARYNDLDSVSELLADGAVAAVIVEPVAGNMGCIPPLPGFLPGLRGLCDTHGSLLIFDEVMTGFRVALGGAQERYRVIPDLTALGKVMAGGTPAAAYGGRADLMRMMAPEGPVYQAGTLAGNPIVTAAGLATLRYLAAHSDLYQRFDDAGVKVSVRLGAAFERAGLPGVVNHVGGMVGIFLGIERAGSWDDVAGIDQALFKRFFQAALRRGVLLPPSPFETWFLMEAHLDGVLDSALDTLSEAIEEVAR